MIKKFNLKLVVFLIACFYSATLSAQINTPSGAVVPFNANPSYPNGIMPTNLPSGGAYGKSQDAANAYNEWKSSYTEACSGGRIRVKFDEPNRTVSEGIGYGMHLAAYAADKALFDGLYAYWKNFQSPASSGKTGKLMNWRIEGCGPSVSGTGSAADADVDAAWALLIAETQWPTATNPYDYASEATNLLYSIRELEINSSGHLINGDGWGFGDNCRNPGYQSPAYYPAFAAANTAYANIWNTTAQNGAYQLINANADATTGLLSDWCNPSGQRNTCNPGGLGYAATDGYGYDACRSPWRMAQDVIWNNNANAKSICNKITAYINGRGAGGVGGPVYQNGNNYSGFSHNATFVSTFAMAVMGTTSANQSLMNAMYTETKNVKDPIKTTTLSGYFGNTLRCVSLFMMSGNYWKVGTTSIQEINIRQAALPIVSGSTYDFQNQQTTPPAASGKSITLTIENLGFSTLNLTGSTRVVLSGTNANQFSVTQPASASLALGASTTFNVVFTPTTTGTKTAVLTIANNDPDENPYIINLTGTGTPNATAPTMTVYDTVNVLTSGSAFPMGAFTVSSTGSKLIKITNTGDAPLNINTATFSNPAFSIASPVLPLAIPIGGKAFIKFNYAAPATPTSSVCTITLTTTDPNATSFVLNATASAAACSANPPNKMMLDYDGNVNLALAFTPVGAFSPITINPSPTGLNLSSTVASYVRPVLGDYDIIRYYNCGTVAGANHAASTYVPFGLTAANPVIQVLIYSPAVGITVVAAPQKPTGTIAWAPIIADFSSNITVTTTKANQWELLSFDMSKIISPTNLVSDFKCLDIQIDPTRTYSSLAANALPAARTFYIDEIKYNTNPCLSDLSGILQDFDDHNNVSLAYTIGALNAPLANPPGVSGGINTSPNVGRFVKNVNAAAYDDGFRYNGCNNKIDLSTKKYISMLVYSPVANASIQMSAKVPDGPDADAFPDDAAASTQLTVFANTWHRLYFDLSTISAANLPNVFGIDIFFDPNDLTTVTAPNNKFYFDDIRLETTLPCVAGIPATDILNDFENNRYLGVVFPGVAAFNTIKANPAPTGINTRTIVGEFIRGIGTTGTSVRFSACQSQLDLAPGHNLIDLKVYSPNANVAVTMSLKNAAGVSLSDVTDTIKLANTWTNLRFDHTNIMNSTSVVFIDIIADPNAVFSATGSTNGARTYLFDDLRYATPAPEINVKALTSPTTTDIPSTGSFVMGTAAIGDSTDVMTFSIQNNGLQTLNLTGTPTLKLGGANPGDFVVTTTQTFTTSVSALGATGFTIKFKPTGTLAGPRSASLTIANNDPNEGTYIIYLNGTATKSIISVLNGATGTAPVIAPNNTPAISVGSAPAGTPAAAYTLTIKNSGIAPLKITSVTPSAGFTVTALTPTGDILTGAIATFTVVGTPATPGVNLGTLTILSNDPTTPSYLVNISVSGSTATMQVLDGATIITTGNTPANVLPTSVINTPNVAKTFTISNTGTAALTVGTITASTGFTVTQVTPVGSIAPAGTATFTVTGTPNSLTVPRTGVITIPSNDPLTPFVLNVSVLGTAAPIATMQVLDGATIIATGNTPAIVLPTSIINTPNVAKTFTVRNTGTAALTVGTITASAGFTVTQVTPAGSIAPAGTATFTVTGTPNSLTVPRTGVITIPSNDPLTPFVLNVSVLGTAAPIATMQVLDGATIITTGNTPANVLPTSIINTPNVAKTFTVRNTGTAALTVGTITASAGFTVTQVTPAGSIAPAGTATFTVIGTPNSTTVPRAGVITIPSNDPLTPFVLNVSVLGTVAPVAIMQVLDGATVVATGNTPAIALTPPVVNTPSAPKLFSITNTGTSTLNVGTITATAGFTVTQIAGPIAAGATSTFTITGTPNSTTVPLAGIITIPSNDPATPYVLNVSVLGTAAPIATLQVLDGATVITNNNTPAVVLAPSVINTPNAPKTFTVRNNGTAALNVGTITATAGFTVTQVTPAGPIVPSGTVTFTVTGTPNSTTVPRAGVITIPSNDPATPFVLNVSVLGTAAPTPSAQVLDGAVIIASNNTPAVTLASPVVNTPSSVKTFTIKNTGTAALNVGTITSTAGFTVTQITPAGAIAAAGSVTFTVVGTPTSTSVATTGVITIPSDDPLAPYMVNVSVIGTTAPTASAQVLDGATIVANNNTPAITLASSIVNTPNAPKTFTVRNNGTAALNVGTITATTGFTVTQVSPAGAIAPAGIATFTVVGTPNSTSVPLTGVVTIPSNDPSTPYSINVSVIGTAAPTPLMQVLNGATVIASNNSPAVVLPSSLINTPNTATTLTINNNGAAALNVGTITVSAGFTITQISPAGAIAPAGSATFTVIGTPNSTTVPLTGVIMIPSNDPLAPFAVNVSVLGTSAPVAALQVLDGATVISSNNTPAIVLASSVVNTPNAAKTFTVRNNGSAALNVGTITTTTGFTITQVSPAGAIAPAGTATFTVVGTPNSTTIPLLGTITIPSNDPATPFVLNVSVLGTATPVAAIQVLDGAIVLSNNNTPAIVLAGSVINTPNAAKSFTIRNNGTAALNVGTITVTAGFTVTQVTPAGAIAPAGTATFNVTGTPNSTTVPLQGTITIPSNDPATPFNLNVSVLGTATPVAALQVADGAIVLASNNTPAVILPASVVNTPNTSKSFTVRNNGTAALNVGTITASAGFTVTQVSPAGAIAPAATATFTVIGTPTSTITPLLGTITIPSNDPATPFILNVSVLGTSAPVAALQVLDGATVLSTNNTPAIVLVSSVINTANTPKTFTVRNNGSAALNVGAITASAGFTVTQVSPAGAIAPATTATFTVTGTPNSTTVPRTGIITIPSNDPATPFVLNVSVLGTAAPAPVVTIPGVINNGPAISIGSAIVGNPTPPYTFTIANTGSSPLNIGTITSSNPDFVVTQVTPNPIPAGSSGTFTVVATPSAVGTSSGAITIPSNDPSSPFVINVAATGTGTPTGPSLQIVGKSNQIIANNSALFIIGMNSINVPTNPYQFTIKNIGSTNLTISNVISSSGFSATAVFPAGPIAPGAFATFSVTGTPNAPTGVRSGTVTIMSNDPGSPFTLNVGVQVGVPTGVATALASSAIDLFPNPSAGNTNLEFNGTFDNVAVTIYTADGSKVYTTELATMSESSALLPVQDLPSGVYFIEVNTTQGKLVKRFIKQ